MYAGGITLKPAQKDRLDTLSDEAKKVRDERQALLDSKTGEQANLDNLSNDTSEAGNEYQIAQEEFSDEKADKDRAEADFRTEKQEARGRERDLEGKVEADEADKRNADKYEREQLDPILEKIKEYEDLARFQFGEWARRLFQQEQMAKLQVICERENEFGDILLSWHAACMKIGAAIAGVGGAASISAAFNPHKYLTIPDERLEDGSRITRKQLDGLYADRDAKQGRLEELRNDPYTAKEVSEARGKLAEAGAKRDEEKRNFDGKTAAADDAKAKRESDREAYQDAQQAQRNMEAVLREYDRKIQAKANEQQQNSDEQQKVVNAASVTT